MEKLLGRPALTAEEEELWQAEDEYIKCAEHVRDIQKSLSTLGDRHDKVLDKIYRRRVKVAEVAWKRLKVAEKNYEEEEESEEGDN